VSSLKIPLKKRGGPAEGQQGVVPTEKAGEAPGRDIPQAYGFAPFKGGLNAPMLTRLR
jgi:hypothetical protein